MKNTNKNHQDRHLPVLLEAVLEYLDPKPGDSYLDLTAGYGGHAGKVLERTLQPEKAILVDRDHNAVSFLTHKFVRLAPRIIHTDFLSASQELKAEGKQFDLILADLGVSSPHLDEASRGFSLRLDGPLDMRMDQTQSLTAEEIVNNYDETELVRIFREYGEEPKAVKMARLIAEHRPIRTTHELAAIVAQAWPGYSKIHPATRVFQALRIAVNAELELLTKALPIWIDLLSPGGRIVVISFHSLEDRLVKKALSEQSGNRYDAVLSLLTKQPVTGDVNEIVFNPRARSAKLRAAVKIKTKQKG
jgi:16S rRNA (cytosine1402-N4)-methyltransferase